MFSLTDSAVEQIKTILAQEGEGTFLRVFVQGGGCSGFQYGFVLESEQNDDDFEFVFDGVRVIVDAMSHQYLESARVNYKEDLSGSSFVIDNPNAVSTCGCGSSFSPY